MDSVCVVKVLFGAIVAVTGVAVVVDVAWAWVGMSMINACSSSSGSNMGNLNCLLNTVQK